MLGRQKKQHGLLARILALMLVLAVMMPGSIAYAAETQAAGGAAPLSSLNIYVSGSEAVVMGFKAQGTSSYTSVEIPASYNGKKVVEISEKAFLGQINLQHIKLPDTLRTIGDDAFRFCTSLQEVTIPGGVSRVGMGAFQRCTSLKSVTILYGVQSIGDGAFKDCKNLSTVAIAPSAKDLDGFNMFDGTDGVVVQANPGSAAAEYNGVRSTVLPDDSPAAYAYEVDPNTGEVLIEGYFGSSKTPVIPEIINGSTVTGIGEGAFEDRPITQVTLPETLKTIGANAFAGTGLTVVDIPSTVTGIGKGAFNDDASVVLKGDCDALDEYIATTQYTKFTPWGPGRTLYHELTVKSSPALAGSILQGRSKQYKKGALITIEAKPKLQDANRGTYRFAGWTLTTTTTVEGKEDELKHLIEAPNFSKTTLRMPEYDITLTANYELIPPEPLIIRKVGGKGTVLLYTGIANQPQLALENNWEYNGETFSVDRIGYEGSFDGRYYSGEVFLDPAMVELDIPMSVEEILPKVFVNATGLQKIQVAEKSQKYRSVDGVLFDRDMTTLVAYPANRPGDTYTIPAGVTKIGPYAFYGNRNLKTIHLGGIESIGERAFLGAASLEQIVIPKTVASLGTYAFYNCRKLSDVTWEDDSQITTIPTYAFAYCPFTEITLPSGATGISNYAYAYCSNLTTINVSKTITSLASNAFYGCNNISAINVEEGNPNYASEDGVLFNAGKTLLMTYPIAKTEADGAYTVPPSVETIGNGAFGHAKFSHVNLNNVKVIEANAFSNSSITDIDLTKVTSIGSTAFSGCSRLAEVAWPKAVTTVPSYAFQNCSSLKKVTLPNEVTAIGSYAFYSCTSLEEAALPASLRTIDNYAFYNCGMLKTLSIPATLTRIGDYAFRSCRGITELALPASCSSVGAYAFASCGGIEKLTVGTASIAAGTFSGCTALESLTLEDTVTSIGAAAFSGCARVQEVETGANIGDSAFSGCTMLATLTLKDSVQSIGQTAFANCNSLTTVSIPKSVSTIGLRAFNTCASLESIQVDPENGSYSNNEGDGVLYNKDKSILIVYPQNKAGTVYTAPDSVKTISNYAFESTNSLTDVTFNKNVGNIGYTLFTGSNTIARIYVYNEKAAFGRTTSYPNQSIFYGIPDSQLLNLVVHGYLGSTAEDEVFAHRIKGVKFMALDHASEGLVIRRVAKNAKQRTIDNQPLGANTWFGEVVGYKVPEAILDQADKTSVIVPSLIDASTKDIMILDESGNEISLTGDQNIIVSTVEAHAFWYPGATTTDSSDPLHTYVHKITSITLPQTITEIKSDAFEDCMALGSFAIPVSVQKIHPYAFRNCVSLTQMEIPANVEMLGGDKLFDESSSTKTYVSAFYGCKNLASIKVASGNRTYADINGVLTNIDKSLIYEVPNAYRGEGDNGDIYNVPNGIEAIGDSAFLGCYNLREIHFPATMKHVGIGAFQGVLTKPNSTITFVENPDAALDLDNEAFLNCTGLTTVTLPPNLERMGDDVFKGCTGIKNYLMPQSQGEQLFYAVDGILYGYVVDDKGTQNYALYQYPAGRTDKEYTINSSVPVRQIYKSAFQDNNVLETITLSKDVQIIQESAFRNCTKLKNVNWGTSTWSIGGMAFSNTGLTELDLPATIADVGPYAFSGCDGLIRANVYRSKVTFGEKVFDNPAEGFTIYGYRDSTAQTYAADNNYAFALLDGEEQTGFKISVSPDIVNGTVTVSKQTANEIEVVNVTVTPDEGYQLQEGSLQYNGTIISAEALSFAMPKEDVVITAVFEPIPSKQEVKMPTSQGDSNTPAPVQTDSDASAGSDTPSVDAPSSEKSEPSGEF